MICIKLTDFQFNTLDLGTRRSIMEQVDWIITPKYSYSLGTSGGNYILVKFDNGKCRIGNQWIGSHKNSEIIDEWRRS